MTATGNPGGRTEHTAIWDPVDHVMIVWGGHNAAFTPWHDGGIYDPSGNSWVAIPAALANAPSARFGHIAVWTGTKMLLWGGSDGTNRLGDGGFYSPDASGGSWDPSPPTTTNAPNGRDHPAFAWTGSVLLIWGGDNGTSFENTGAQFAP